MQGFTTPSLPPSLAKQQQPQQSAHRKLGGALSNSVHADESAHNPNTNPSHRKVPPISAIADESAMAEAVLEQQLREIDSLIAGSDHKTRGGRGTGIVPGTKTPSRR